MFCRQCGKEIREDWKSCAYCGAEIQIAESETSESGNDISVAESKDTKTDFAVGNTRITGRLILKILALIAVICFFCPLYMVSCAGQEITSLNGVDMTFGFQYMDEDIEGNLIFGLLIILPIVSFCSAFISKKILESNKRNEKLKEKSYSCATCSCSMVLLARYFTSTLEKSASGSGIGIAPCAALNIMCAVGLISMVIGGYLAFLAEPRMKGGKQLNTKMIAVKSVGIIIGASLAFIAIISFAFANESRLSTVRDDYTEDSKSSDVDNGEGTDLSQIDMEEFIGASKVDMEKLGFEDGVYQETRVDYDDNDAVNMILIEGAGDVAPSFHGVTIGMQRDEAAEALGNVYTMLGVKDTEGFIRLNTDTGQAVTCVCEKDKVKSIMYSIYSENDVEQFRRTVSEKLYIFPDSDKKYLSEDEVRSIGADKLTLGKNEIFARHGRMFDDQQIAVYFSSQPWYNGTIPAAEFNSDAVFNDFEKKNVELIKRIEDEANGSSGGQADFIGVSGVYQCGSDINSGVIDVYVDGNTFNIGIGTQGQRDILGGTGGGMSGTIINGSTATVVWDSCTFTLTWSNAGTFTITREGSTGIAEVDGATNGAYYVNARY